MHTVNTRLATIAIAIAIVMILCPQILRADSSVMLNLICRGSGIANKSESANINTYDPKTKKYTTTTAQSSSKEPFNGVAVVEIAGHMGRIKLPEPMIPPLNTRDDGWFKIKELVVNEDEITGKVTINFLNSKTLRIDRHSGLMTIEGGGSSFSGQCEAVDRAAPKKF
jgi:hypothetical protein